MKALYRMWTTGAVLLIGAAASRADTVTLTFDTVAPYRPVTISIDAGATWEYVLAGQMMWTQTGGPQIAGADSRLASFCIEPSQSVTGGHYDYQLGDAASAPEPGAIGPGLGIGAVHWHEKRRIVSAYLGQGRLCARAYSC